MKTTFSINRLALVILIMIFIGSVFSHETKGQTTVDNLLKLTIEGNNYSDQTFILFLEDATTGFDSEYDAYKLFGDPDAPQLYSIIPCCSLSINTLPEIPLDYEVQLGVKFGVNTDYTITADELDSFGADTNIYLEDTKESVIIDLRANPVYTFTGKTTDAETRFKVLFEPPRLIDITVFLEGPFNGAEMNTDLNSQGLIPLNQPYNTTPWNYGGTESVTSIPNPNVVDWVLVELRDATDAASAGSGTVIEQHACFVLNDGTVTQTDGVTSPGFTADIINNAFIVIKHRNHLGVLSASSPAFVSGSLFEYDFSTGMDKYYQNTGDAAKLLGGGIYGMFTGDGNANGIINNTDKTSIWSIIVGKKGYLSGDYDLNGQTNNQDKNDSWYPNQNESTQIP